MFREKIHAVTVCIDCGDFLKETAKHNAQHFDKWTVVTVERDEETRHICRIHGIHCLLTEDATRDGGTFGKGRLVERGLQHLHYDAWVLHLDSDIVLPGRFREYLDRAHLDESKVYGVDRFMIKSWADWKKLEYSGWIQASNNGHQHNMSIPHNHPLGSRWIGQDGWVPIGFFQLWHRAGGQEEWKGHRAKPYPVGHGNACREDVQHTLQWDRRDRILIPEIIVAHLESEPAPCGANWSGRTTAKFGPPPANKPAEKSPS